MAGGINPIGNLLGKVDANGALLVSIAGGALPAISTIAFTGGNVLDGTETNRIIDRNGTNAKRFDVANTYTSLTNNELFSVDWQTQANVALVGTRTVASTANTRALRLVSQQANGNDDFALVNLSVSSPFVRFDRGTGAIGAASTGGTGNFFQFGGAITSTTTSGSVAFTAILPTYNQASGTAANTDLLVNRTQTAVGSGAQYLFQAQVGASDRFRVDTSGSVATAGANGQVFTNVQSLTELTTIAAAATTDTTIQMPANSVVLGVSVRVTTVIPTAATFTVGDSGSAARFSTAAVAVAANSTDSGTKAGAYYNASALSVRITPNLTPGANTGRVRVTIYYYTITPPTS